MRSWFLRAAGLPLSFVFLALPCSAAPATFIDIEQTLVGAFAAHLPQATAVEEAPEPAAEQLVAAAPSEPEPVPEPAAQAAALPDDMEPEAGAAASRAPETQSAAAPAAAAIPPGPKVEAADPRQKRLALLRQKASRLSLEHLPRLRPYAKDYRRLVGAVLGYWQRHIDRPNAVQLTNLILRHIHEDYRYFARPQILASTTEGVNVLKAELRKF